MAPFDRSHTSSYWCSVVTIAISCIISAIKRLVESRDCSYGTPPAFDAPVRSDSRSFKVIWYNILLRSADCGVLSRHVTIEGFEPNRFSPKKNAAIVCDSSTRVPCLWAGLNIPRLMDSFVHVPDFNVLLIRTLMLGISRRSRDPPFSKLLSCSRPLIIVDRRSRCAISGLVQGRHGSHNSLRLARWLWDDMVTQCLP